jgi:outer membrane receptor for ferrienterochelin and colicin
MLKNRFIFIAVLIALLVAPLYAQTTTSQITGVVTTGDTPLPGVTVTISSPQMQGTRTAVTGDAGGYNFAGIPPGAYQVRFELSGMTTVTQTTRVGVGQTGRADAKLGVSTVSEAITVTATTASVLETPTVSQNLNARLVENLPTSRTVLGTAALAPGVNTNTTAANQLSISGSPGYDNLVMVNGVAITESVRSQSLPLFIEDAIQETTVMTGAISAEYGRFTGGVVNSISKSGGNQFSGSARISLANPQWTSRTPSQIALNSSVRDFLGKTYQETLGGYILRDRLWFFAAGRQTKSDTPGLLRTIPGRPTNSGTTFDTVQDEKRWEGKLTGQLAANHNLAASYLKTDQATTDSVFTTTSYGAEQLTDRTDPYKLETLSYNGVLTNNWLLEGVGSKMHWGVGQGSGSQFTDFVNGTIVRNRADGNARFNSPTFCGVCDKETRSNDSVTLKSSYFLSTKSLGNQNIVGGIEQFREHRHANNYQSGSNFRFFVNSIQSPDGVKIYPTVTPGTAVSAAYLVWTPIFNLQQGDSNLATKSAFVNDRWDLNNHWSFNAGVRYDKNAAVDGSGNKVSDDSKFSPRFSAAWDITGNGRHRLTASYGEYSSRIVEGPGTASSSAGAPGYIYYSYLGPAINPAGTPADQLIDTKAALAIVNDWFTHACNAAGQCGTSNLSLIRPGFAPSVPGYDTRISSTLASPFVREISLGYGAQWTNNLVTRVDLISRDWRDFYGSRIDSSTPQQTDLLGLRHDVAIIENTNLIKREYRGIQFQTTWHPRSFNAGLNYTYSKLRGNDEQENATSGTVGNAPGAINYPELTNYANNQPMGYLAQDQRHRVRAWIGYDLPFLRFVGNFNVSLLQTYDSGLPYFAARAIDLSPYVSSLVPAGSKYVTAPVSRNYYFGGRSPYRLDDVATTNFALNYERPIGRVALFAHYNMTNLFNRSTATAVNTTVNTAFSSAAFAAFNPFTTTPVECPQGTATARCTALGANYQKSATFGQTTAFQTPRTYSVNAGVRF